MRLLSNPMIQRVYQAAERARLDRDVLISSVAARLASTMPGPILSDLLRLNEAQLDGDLPLKRWLEMAALLAGPEAQVFREALTQLHEAVSARIASPQTGEVPAAGVEALRQLLLKLFSADELRRFIRYRPRGDEMIAALPGGTASLADVACAAANLLARIERVDDLFAAIEAERPRRRAEIQAVRQKFAQTEIS